MNNPSGWAGISRHMSSSSALNPTLLLCLMFVCVGLPLATFSEGLFRYLLLTIVVIPMVLAVWQIIRFTSSDPDRLQNDKHVENKMLIHRIGGTIGGERTEIALPIDGTVIENPHIAPEQ